MNLAGPWDSVKPAHSYLAHRGGKGPTFAIREGDWKLIMDLDESEQGNRLNVIPGAEFPKLFPTALFNLQSNVGEDDAQNLVHDPAHTSRVKEMLAAYRRLRQSDEPTAVNHRSPQN